MTDCWGPMDAPRRPPGLPERIFLWLPKAEKPGLLAYGLSAVRMVVFPVAITLTLVLLTSLLHLPLTPLSPAGLVVTLAPAAAFEELARYAFVRRARDPLRAIILFTLCTMVLESVTFYDAHLSLAANLGQRAPSWIVHVMAGAAILGAVRRRDRYPRLPMQTLVALIVVHSLFNVMETEASIGSQAVAAPPAAVKRAP